MLDRSTVVVGLLQILALSLGLTGTLGQTRVAEAQTVTVTNTTPTNYVWEKLKVGGKVYVDRSFTYTSVPAHLQGLSVLRTANNDKRRTGGGATTFHLRRPATVYVAYDARRTVVPSWLAEWHDSGHELVTSDTRLRVYARDIPAGLVKLGGNETFSMYTVVLGSQVDGSSGSGGGSNSSGGYSHNGTGSVELSWLPPLENVDGTALTDLAGYRIYHGTNSGSYSKTVDVRNPGITSYTIEGLQPGTHFFAMRAYDSSGNWSPYSKEITKTIEQ